jgi:regulatory protein
MKSGRITAVHQDSKNKQRYHIYVDEQLAFSVHEDILVKYNLFKGTEIDPVFWEEIISAEERNKAYLLALRYIGIRPRTANQLEKYLTDKGFSAETAREIKQRCEQAGYIDDAAFAKQWVCERMRLKAKSALVLRMELQQRGISRDLIEMAIQQISREDEAEAARKLAAKRLKRASHPLSWEEERKLCLMLQRKGFSQAAIQQVRRELREHENS